MCICFMFTYVLDCLYMFSVLFVIEMTKPFFFFPMTRFNKGYIDSSENCSPFEVDVPVFHFFITRSLE